MLNNFSHVYWISYCKKYLVSKCENFYTILLQIHSGKCLQKIGILYLSLIKLLQNEQGCNFFASQCILKTHCDQQLEPSTTLRWWKMRQYIRTVHTWWCETELTCSGVKATLDAVPATCFLTVVLPPQTCCFWIFCCNHIIHSSCTVYTEQERCQLRHFSCR